MKDNAKITLTIGQLKRLVLEDNDEVGNTQSNVIPIDNDNAGSIQPHKVYITSDKDFLKTYIESIYTMMTIGYAKIGGMERLASSPKNLLRRSDLFKLVFDENKSILACSTYKNYLGGNKLFLCSGQINGGEGAEAMEQIVITDIEPYNNWFWGEASGAIEHYFKKHHGHAIPNYMAYEFLGKPKEDIVLDPRGPEVDPIHYKRLLGDPSDAEWKIKSLWGFKDQAMADKVMSEIQKDPNFQLKAESVVARIFEGANETTKRIEFAIKVIDEITEFNEEKNCDEMLPAWNEKLNQSIDILNSELQGGKVSSDMLRRIRSALNAASIIRSSMPVLTMRKFSIGG